MATLAQRRAQQQATSGAELGANVTAAIAQLLQSMNQGSRDQASLDLLRQQFRQNELNFGLQERSQELSNQLQELQLQQSDEASKIGREQADIQDRTVRATAIREQVVSALLGSFDPDRAAATHGFVFAEADSYARSFGPLGTFAGAGREQGGQEEALIRSAIKALSVEAQGLSETLTREGKLSPEEIENEITQVMTNHLDRIANAATRSTPARRGMGVDEIASIIVEEAEGEGTFLQRLSSEIMSNEEFAAAYEQDSPGRETRAKVRELGSLSAAIAEAVPEGTEIPDNLDEIVDLPEEVDLANLIASGRIPEGQVADALSLLQEDSVVGTRVGNEISLKGPGVEETRPIPNAFADAGTGDTFVEFIGSLFPETGLTTELEQTVRLESINRLLNPQAAEEAAAGAEPFRDGFTLNEDFTFNAPQGFGQPNTTPAVGPQATNVPPTGGDFLDPGFGQPYTTPAVGPQATNVPPTGGAFLDPGFDSATQGLQDPFGIAGLGQLMAAAQDPSDTRNFNPPTSSFQGAQDTDRAAEASGFAAQQAAYEAGQADALRQLLTPQPLDPMQVLQMFGGPAGTAQQSLQGFGAQTPVPPELMMLFQPQGQPLTPR